MKYIWHVHRVDQVHATNWGKWKGMVDFKEYFASTLAARQKGKKARDVKIMNWVISFVPNSELLKLTARLVA